MKYRELKKEEADILKDFLYEAIFIPEGVTPPDKSIVENPELKIYYEDFGSKEADFCIAAVDKGNIVGAAWSRIMDDYGHIDDHTPSLSISLYPSYRSKGHGRMLMKKLMEKLKEKGYKKVSLSVQKGNYAYIYKHNYRINSVKEELIKEKYGSVLFHGSKNGLSNITISESRNNCDFGKGFYLGQTYPQALSFVCEYDKASVYSFNYSFDGLKCVEFDCSLDWMIAICHFRGIIKKYAESELVQKILKKIENADVIIAPIADNKMFYVMSQFAEGEINADAAIHSLSASRLGLQYIIKTDKALKRLVPIERYYLSEPEREDCRSALIERGYEIDTKLKLAKREFRTELYIEELLK